MSALKDLQCGETFPEAGLTRARQNEAWQVLSGNLRHQQRGPSIRSSARPAAGHRTDRHRVAGGDVECNKGRSSGPPPASRQVMINRSATRQSLTARSLSGTSPSGWTRGLHRPISVPMTRQDDLQARLGMRGFARSVFVPRGEQRERHRRSGRKARNPCPISRRTRRACGRSLSTTPPGCMPAK